VELMPGYLVVMEDLQDSDGVLKERFTFSEMLLVLVFGVI